MQHGCNSMDQIVSFIYFHLSGLSLQIIHNRVRRMERGCIFALAGRRIHVSSCE